MDFADIKVGVYMLLKENPCRIVEVKTSSPGKHGHAKKAVTGMDIFTGKKYQSVFNHHTRVIPVTTNRLIYSGMDVDDEGYLCLMDDNGETREDLQLHDQTMLETANKYLEDPGSFQVTILTAMWLSGDSPTSREKILSVAPEN